MRARWSASAVGQEQSTSTADPAARRATTANSTAIPQQMTCWRPAGVQHGQRAVAVEKTSSRSPVAVNRHGCVLWIEGARVAVATIGSHSQIGHVHSSLVAAVRCRSPDDPLLPTVADPRPPAQGS